MEANHKRRGSSHLKSMLAKSFCRVTKPSSLLVRGSGGGGTGSSKVRPSPPTPSGSVDFIVSQTFAFPSSVQKVTSTTKPVVGFLEFGGGGDENVDAKAASFISYVRQRLEHEKADSDAS